MNPTKRDIETRLSDLDADHERESDSGIRIAFEDPETGELFEDEDLEIPYDAPQEGVTVVVPVRSKW